MESQIIPPSEEKTYPCLVIDKMTGDGKKPTVFLKPNKFVSVVVVIGYMAMQMEWELGHIIDADNPATASDFGLEKGEGVHTSLPLFKGEVILKN